MSIRQNLRLFEHLGWLGVNNIDVYYVDKPASYVELSPSISAVRAGVLAIRSPRLFGLG